MGEIMERITEKRAIELFEEMLDECYPTWDIAGYGYLPSDILKSVDEINYRCIFNDYCDAQGWELYDETN